MSDSPDNQEQPLQEQPLTVASAEEVKRFINAAWDGDRGGINAFLDKFGEGQIAVTKGEPIAWTALHWAAKSGAAAGVAALLARGAAVDKLDAHGSTPLMVAARYGKTEAVQVLLTGGADVAATDGEGKTSAEIAAKADYPGIAEAVGKAAAAREKIRREAEQAAEEAVRARASAFQDTMRATAKQTRLRLRSRGPS